MDKYSLQEMEKGAKNHSLLTAFIKQFHLLEAMAEEMGSDDVKSTLSWYDEDNPPYGELVPQVTLSLKRLEEPDVEGTERVDHDEFLKRLEEAKEIEQLSITVRRDK